MPAEVEESSFGAQDGSEGEGEYFPRGSQRRRLRSLSTLEIKSKYSETKNMLRKAREREKEMDEI